MKTVGQALAEARRALNYTLADAERETKIRSEILQKLEQDDFSHLPSSTYIKGFITLYGDFLGLDQDTLLALFRRQYDEKENQPIKVLPDLNPDVRPKLTMTPARALGLGIAVLVLGFLGYLLAQYQSFAAAPALEITSPAETSKVNNGTIQVVGRTDRDATLKINGQLVELTPTGAFSVSVTLPDGTTNLTFSAVNKLGRVTTLKRTVTVEAYQAQAPIGPLVSTPSAKPTVAATSAATPATPSAKPQPIGIELTLKIGPAASWVKVQSDAVTFEGILYPGVTKTFKAQTQVVVTTGNAGSTSVTVNGVDQGKIGADNQVVTKTFTR